MGKKIEGETRYCLTFQFIVNFQYHFMKLSWKYFLNFFFSFLCHHWALSFGVFTQLFHPTGLNPALPEMRQWLEPLMTMMFPSVRISSAHKDRDILWVGYGLKCGWTDGRDSGVVCWRVFFDPLKFAYLSLARVEMGNRKDCDFNWKTYSVRNRRWNVRKTGWNIFYFDPQRAIGGGSISPNLQLKLIRMILPHQGKSFCKETQILYCVVKSLFEIFRSLDILFTLGSTAILYMI